MATQTRGKPGPKLTADKRRQMVLRVLSEPDANITQIAAEYGVDRTSIYGLIARAMRDPKAQWREAEAEAEFRKKVYELTR